MPLTPAEVRGVQFATTRLRSGYDMDEVDAFLDIIEADVAQLTDDLQRSRDGEAVLRTQCDQLQQRVALAERRVAELEASTVASVVTSAPVPGPVAVTQELMEALAGHAHAAEILDVAQRTAEQIVGDAQQQAEGVRDAVRRVLDDQRAVLDRG